MAAPVVGLGLTLINDADALGAWNNVGGGTPTAETDFYIQGSGSVATRVSGTSGNGAFYFPVASKDYSATDDHLYIWLYCTGTANLRSINDGGGAAGLQVIALSGNNENNYAQFFVNGNEDLGDWDLDFHDNWVMNHSTTPYQFSKGKYSIDGKEFEDYLILNRDFYSEDYGDNVFEEPFNGVNSMVNYKGYQIFHPSENKFVPVSLICTGSYLHDQLNLDIVFNDKKQLKKLAEIFDGSSEFRYATDVADYLLRLKL